jgi:hypothetical protein
MSSSQGILRGVILFLAIFFIRISAGYAQFNALVWSDEFDYTGLPAATKWTCEVGGGGWGNNELQYYTLNDSHNARVEDGILIIEALKESMGGR